MNTFYNVLHSPGLIFVNALSVKLSEPAQLFIALKALVNNHILKSKVAFFLVTKAYFKKVLMG